MIFRKLLLKFFAFSRSNAKLTDLPAYFFFFKHFLCSPYTTKQHIFCAKCLANITANHYRPIIGIVFVSLETHHPRKSVFEQQFLKIALADHVLNSTHCCCRRPNTWNGINFFRAVVGTDTLFRPVTGMRSGNHVSAVNAHRTVITC